MHLGRTQDTHLSVSLQKHKHLCQLLKNKRTKQKIFLIFKNPNLNFYLDRSWVYYGWVLTNDIAFHYLNREEKKKIGINGIIAVEMITGSYKYWEKKEVNADEYKATNVMHSAALFDHSSVLQRIHQLIHGQMTAKHIIWLRGFK